VGCHVDCRPTDAPTEPNTGVFGRPRLSYLGGTSCSQCAAQVRAEGPQDGGGVQSSATADDHAASGFWYPNTPSGITWAQPVSDPFNNGLASSRSGPAHLAAGATSQSSTVATSPWRSSLQHLLGRVGHRRASREARGGDDRTWGTALIPNRGAPVGFILNRTRGGGTVAETVACATASGSPTSVRQTAKRLVVAHELAPRLK